MGLDMYLYAKKYLGDWNHDKGKERTQYRQALEAAGIPDFRCEGSPSLTVKVTVAYWRKANAIHAWFVKNVQGGKDKCEETPVERAQLEALVNICNRVLESVETVEGDISNGTTHHPGGRVEHHTVRGRVLAQVAIAEKLLPTQDGFFFGSTEYSEYYLADLHDTVDQISAILQDPRFNDFDFTYRSSW